MKTWKNQEELMELIYEEVMALKQEMGSMKKDMTSLKAEVSSMKKDIASLKADVSSLKKDVTSLKADVYLLKAETAELRREMNQHVKRLEAQAQSNFEILDRDLGAAMDFIFWVKEKKVDKSALRQAAM